MAVICKHGVKILPGSKHDCEYTDLRESCVAEAMAAADSIHGKRPHASSTRYQSWVLAWNVTFNEVVERLVAERTTRLRAVS